VKNIAKSLESVHRQIRATEAEFERTPGTVGLVAVSKTRPPEDIQAALNAGQFDFGENYAREAVDKIERIGDKRAVWHFIGPVQSNKTRIIARYFQWLHSIDRVKIARRLSEARPDSLPPLNVCLQVNISDEKTKSGVPLAELPALLEECAGLPRLNVRGLMAIPAPAKDFSMQRQPFRQLKLALEQLNRQGHQLDTLSMGTSEDFRAAIAEGSTLVRIGTAIFGHRS
jgi:pyridoxal phosphate enzyme (YggS family)